MKTRLCSGWTGLKKILNTRNSQQNEYHHYLLCARLGLARSTRTLRFPCLIVVEIVQTFLRRPCRMTDSLVATPLAINALLIYYVHTYEMQKNYVCMLYRHNTAHRSALQSRPENVPPPFRRLAR